MRDITDAVRLVRTRKDIPEFNKKPLINLRNGTFELDTKTFREHRPEDYCTSITPYDYDAKADCPMFKKFLLEVTDNNESRLNTLRDTLGYILYPNCKLQKMFLWYGHGNNGKNTLADTIGAVFDNVNQNKAAPFVTGEPLSKFQLPTSRIMLMHSGLNIASEASINLRGNEDVIKKVCSGDLIDGNRKFRDIEYFRSRTKIICCCNEIPALNDNSYGMTRRLIFVEFVRDFTKQLDADLPDKLKAELPGILNYIIECYFELKQRNYIRECCDQSKLMREFSSNASSVYSFYDSYRYHYSGNTIPTAEVWKQYLNWCRESFIPQIEVKKNKNFQSEFLRLIEKDGSKRERLRLNGKQTYCYVFATISTEAGDVQEVDDVPDIEYTEAENITETLEPEYETLPETSNDFTEQVTHSINWTYEPSQYDKSEDVTELEKDKTTEAEIEQVTQTDPELEINKLVKLNYSAMSTSEFSKRCLEQNLMFACRYEELNYLKQAINS